MAVTAVNTPSRISSPPMRLVPRLPATAALCLVAGLAQAAVVQRVDVVGVDEAMAENVYRSLTVVDAIGRDVSGRRMAKAWRSSAM